MPAVQLIVTGDMEQRSLHRSLGRLFPKDGAGELVDWRPPIKHNEVTTHRLLPLSTRRGPSAPMQKLAQALATESLQGKVKAHAAPALVLALCDVEVHNHDQIGLIVTHLREALTQHLSTFESQTRARHAERLRTRCSFHLARPMTEAWLFGDPHALRRLGVAPGRPHLRSRDWEDFESIDPAWLPRCAAIDALHHNHKQEPWWREATHPKRYLTFLTDEADPYDEVLHGAPALEGLDWPALPVDPSATPYLRALIDDIADALGLPSPLSPGHPAPLTSPSRSQRAAERTLRNL